MTDEIEPASRDQDRTSHTLTQSLVILCNAVATGLGALYATTRSVVVTALAAGLVALLTLCVVLVHRRH